MGGCWWREKVSSWLYLRDHSGTLFHGDLSGPGITTAEVIIKPLPISILDFFEEDSRNRRRLVDKLKAVSQREWDSCDVIPFGRP